MNKRLILLITFLAFAAGLAGGTAGSQLVLAKDYKIIKGQEFQLLDAQDNTKCTLSLTSKGYMFLAMHDSTGKITDSVVVTPELIKNSQKTADTLEKLHDMFNKK